MGGPADRKAEFYEKIKPLIKPGDVINFDTKTDWYNLHLKVAYWGIRTHQRELFGLNSRWRDTHTMLYLDDEKILSVEPIHARWAKLQNFYNDRITVWRFSKRDLSPDDIKIMEQAAEPLIGTVYDVGQLLDIAINAVLGYPHVIKYRVFDFSQYCKVCSVGVRICFEHLRKTLNLYGHESFPRLFSTFKFDTWPMRLVVAEDNTECKGVDVEATAPAHFANSHDFDNEFEMVAQFDNGQQIFPEPVPVPADVEKVDDNPHGSHDHGHGGDHDHEHAHH